MAEEILFRGKRVFIYNPAWEYGALLNEVAGGKAYILTDAYIDDSADLQFEYAPVDPSTVSQYTGLRDKNGKQIFENDIVQIVWEAPNRKPVYETAVIIFKDGAFCTKWVSPNFCGGVYPLHNHNKRAEVIGNIYDNPELLEVRNDD